MSLPLVRLNGLDLIRGFVAVGRRMSITLAAQDLCLTQSAVSRQVHALEAQLGVKLLVRAHRSISFTPEGERLFRSSDSAVQQLQDVLGEIRKSSVKRPVTIAASIGVTGLWLLPRLGQMQKRHPGIDVRVSANNRVSDLRVGLNWAEALAGTRWGGVRLAAQDAAQRTPISRRELPASAGPLRQSNVR